MTGRLSTLWARVVRPRRLRVSRRGPSFRHRLEPERHRGPPQLRAACRSAAFAAQIVAIVLVGGGAGGRGCFEGPVGGGVAWCPLRKTPIPSSKRPARIVNRYTAICSSRRGAGGFGFVRFPFDLWGPFTVAARLGVFRADREAGVGSGLLAFELDARGPLPLEFCGWYTRLEAGGTSAFAYERGPGDAEPSLAGQRFFPGVKAVDVEIRHDGANLVFSARAAGAPNPLEVVATVPFVQQSPLNPAFGASGVGALAEAAFDRFEISMTGASPVAVSPAHGAVSDLFLAVAPVLHAHNTLDGTPDPDVDAAVAALSDAAARIAVARSSVATIPEAPKRLRARSLARVARADAAVARARRLLEQKGAAKAPAVVASLEKSVVASLAAAIDAILPQDLRDSLPGADPE